MISPLAPAAQTPTVRWLAVTGADCDPAWWTVLDAEERRRAEAFRRDGDRALFAAAHWLARTMLAEATGVAPAALRFARDPGGKPRLTGQQAAPDFSLTHTRGLVACAIARDAAIGIDAEYIDRQGWTGAVASTFFAAAEVRQIEAAAGQARIDLFYRLWTLKEAVVKATGAGIAQPFDGFAVDLAPPAPRLVIGAAENPAIWSLSDWLPTPDHRLAMALRHADDQRG